MMRDMFATKSTTTAPTPVSRANYSIDYLSDGWLKDASQTLEYGKNYEGYWTGELFVKQVTFILANSLLTKSFTDAICFSFARRLYQHLKRHTALDIKP
jgi:hypothetical protein